MSVMIIRKHRSYRITTVADDSRNDTLHAMAEWQPGKQCVLAQTTLGLHTNTYTH